MSRGIVDVGRGTAGVTAAAGCRRLCAVLLALSVVGLGFSVFAPASLSSSAPAASASRALPVHAPNGVSAGYISAPGVIGAFPPQPTFSDSRLFLGNRDGISDGVSLGALKPCSTATMIVLINARKLPRALRRGNLVLNAWFDWGRAGTWTGAGCGIADWEVQNLHVTISAIPGTGVLALPVVFRTGDQVQEFWYRVTLSLGTDFTSFAGAAPGPLRFGESEDYHYIALSTGAAEFAAGAKHGRHGPKGKASDLVAPIAQTAQGGDKPVSCNPGNVNELNWTSVKLNINPPGTPKPDYHGTLTGVTSNDPEHPGENLKGQIDGRYFKGDDYRGFLHLAANQIGAARGEVIIDSISFLSADDKHGSATGEHYEDDGFDKAGTQTVTFHFSFTRGGVLVESDLECTVTVTHEHLARKVVATTRASKCEDGVLVPASRHALDTSSEPKWSVNRRQYSEPHGLIVDCPPPTQPPGGAGTGPPTPNPTLKLLNQASFDLGTHQPQMGAVLDANTAVKADPSMLWEFNPTTGQILATQTLNLGSITGVQIGQGMVAVESEAYDSKTTLYSGVVDVFNQAGLSPAYGGKNTFTFTNSSNSVFLEGGAFVPGVLNLLVSQNNTDSIAQINLTTGIMSNPQALPQQMGAVDNATSIAVDPSDPNIIYVGGSRDLNSTNYIFVDKVDGQSLVLQNSQQVTVSGSPAFPRIGVGKQGQLYVVFDDFTSPGPKVAADGITLTKDLTTILQGPVTIVNPVDPNNTFLFPFNVTTVTSGAYEVPVVGFDYDQTTSTGSSSTIFLSRSTDGGKTWGDPQIVVGGTSSPSAGVFLVQVPGTGDVYLDYWHGTGSGFTDITDALGLR